MARTAPTMVASSPMARWRKPPTLALAYISPARSSKRRMSIIERSHSRATSGSGSSWLVMSCASVAMSPGKVAGLAGTRPAPGRPAGSNRRSARLLVPLPTRQEGFGFQLREIGPQGSNQPSGERGKGIPEEHHLSRVDLDDLDGVAAPRVGQQRRRAAAAPHDQLVGPVRLHRAGAPRNAAAASGSSPS